MKLYNLFILFFFLAACKDDDMPGMETPALLTIHDVTVNEGNEPKSIFVDLRLSKPVADTVIAFIQSMDGTAKAGEDFQEIVFKPLVFTPGDLIESYRIELYGDEEFEEDEEFTIAIEEAVGADISNVAAKITLLNDDLDTSLHIPETGYSTPESYPGMQLIWSDEFNGTQLNEDFWSYEIGTGSNGWGNNELQYYRRENTSIKEGNLVIEARKEGFGGRNFTSSRLITANKFDFQYGRVDIRAALPYGQGIWPALWMLGKNIGQVGWPRCGEIDVMEMIGGGPGRDDTVHGTAHWQNANNEHSFIGEGVRLDEGIYNDEFHVFSIIWDEEAINWYMDDNHFYTFSLTPADRSEFKERFFLIFNVAVGGNWPGSPNDQTVFPQRMIVDYIRVFQPE